MTIPQHLPQYDGELRDWWSVFHDGHHLTIRGKYRWESGHKHHTTLLLTYEQALEAASLWKFSPDNFYDESHFHPEPVKFPHQITIVKVDLISAAKGERE